MFAILPYYCFLPDSVLEHEMKNLDFRPLAGVILSPRPAQLGNLVSLQPRPGKTRHSKWLESEISLQQKGWRTTCPGAGGRMGELSFTIYLETLQKCFRL